MTTSKQLRLSSELGLISAYCLGVVPWHPWKDGFLPVWHSPYWAIFARCFLSAAVSISTLLLQLFHTEQLSTQAVVDSVGDLPEIGNIAAKTLSSEAPEMSTAHGSRDSRTVKNTLWDWRQGLAAIIDDLVWQGPSLANRSASSNHASCLAGCTRLYWPYLFHNCSYSFCAMSKQFSRGQYPISWTPGIPLLISIHLPWLDSLSTLSLQGSQCFICIVRQKALGQDFHLSWSCIISEN